MALNLSAPTRTGLSLSRPTLRPIAQSKPSEGTIYVASTGQTFSHPTVTAERILKYQDNIYVAGALDKQQRTLFKDKKQFRVQGVTPEGDIDEGLTERLTTMCKAPGVDLWFSLQLAWRESAIWGPALFSPGWDYVGSEYKLVSLRHLPSVTFTKAGVAFSRMRNPILPGILLNEETEQIEYWQTQVDGTVKRLENVAMITDPIRGGVIGGRPLILPVIPVITMIDFCWTGQMQQNNRLGAGGLFYITVTNPRNDDKDYAQKIINNISRGVAYQLRENMTIQNLGLTSTSTALDTIGVLDTLMSNYFSPASSIQKEGTLIGGSSGPEYDLYMSYIQGQQAWIESSFEVVLQPYLDANGYEGYTIEVDIPEPSIDKSELWLKVVDTGFATQSMTVNERRQVLAKTGAELEELSPEQAAAMAQEFSAGSPQMAMAQSMRDANSLNLGQNTLALNLKRAEVVANAAKSDGLDPYSVISKKAQKRVYRETLGLEE